MLANGMKWFEANHGDQPTGVDVRELFLDLVALAPDEDHGVYPSSTIYDLQRRARQIMIDGVGN